MSAPRFNFEVLLERPGACLIQLRPIGGEKRLNLADDCSKSLDIVGKAEGLDRGQFV